MMNVGANEELVSILQYHQPADDYMTTMDQLYQLDSWTRPGLTVAEFKRLFAKCHCGLIMTRRVIDDYECLRTTQPQRIVIDLTATSDDG
jgi:hypothetical protein